MERWPDCVAKAPCHAHRTDFNGEVSEWLKVPLSKSGRVNSPRGFKSHPLRPDDFAIKDRFTDDADRAYDQ